MKRKKKKKKRINVLLPKHPKSLVFVSPFFKIEKSKYNKS